jgi:hypothetical protein
MTVRISDRRLNMSRLILRFLILLSLLSMLASGQTNPPASSEKRTKASSLELPSLSIFGWSPATVSKDVDTPFSAIELEQFLTEVEKDEAKNKSAKHDRTYWIIPMIFYKSRTLFSQETWTVEEIEQGHQISDFFARLTHKPELRIDKADQQSFREGLVKLRDWFRSMCQDNKTLSSMIFTLDDGPFFGGNIDTTQYPKMKLVASAVIPGKQASFVLMTDEGKPDPMIIGVLNEDKSVRWLKRFSNAPNGRIAEAQLEKPTLYKVEGYGYVVALMTDGSSGRERSHVYLDELLDLRFYYVSW